MLMIGDDVASGPGPGKNCVVNGVLDVHHLEGCAFQTFFFCLFRGFFVHFSFVFHSFPCLQLHQNGVEQEHPRSLEGPVFNGRILIFLLRNPDFILKNVDFMIL